MEMNDPRDAKWVQRYWDKMSGFERAEVLIACNLPAAWQFRAFVPDNARLHSMLKG